MRLEIHFEQHIFRVIREFVVGAQVQRPPRMKDGEEGVGDAEGEVVAVGNRLDHHVVRIDDAERSLDLPRNVTGYT